MKIDATEILTQHAIEILRALVSFNSTSHLSNVPLILHIEDYLARHQVPYELIPSPDNKKNNLLARIGPEMEGGLVLSGHTDVVPIEGQQWESDPFTLLERDGKLYGRGTCDMKAFIAVCLAFVPEWKKLALQKPIYLAFSYDEEVGCLGVPHMLDYIDQHIPKPAFAVIGEPTQMRVVTAHKGMLSFETNVHGLEWHSSQTHYGVNAVQAACELVHTLGGVAQELAQSGKRDERFDPPYSTVHVGVIEGGTARNIVPKECRILWEIRPLPGENTDAIVARYQERCRELVQDMQRVSKEADIVTRAISQVGAVTLPAEARPHCQRVMRAAQTNREYAISFFTEGGAFQQHGIPAIICGPGSVEQAHKPNEFIDIAQIRACVDFIGRLTADPS